MLLTAFGKKPCPEVFALCKTGRMRKLLILFFVAFCQQIPLQSNGQSISLEVRDEPLEKVFTLVQRQTPYRFVYTSEDLAATKRVTLSLTNASIAIFLEKIFKDQPVDYNLRGQVIMVRRINRPLSPVQPDGITITGKVIDEGGMGLPAVTIMLKGNSMVTATDEKGAFVLRNADSIGSLLVSSIGYESKQVAVQGRTFIIIQLVRSVNNLDEMVIKGYYNTTTKLNTGSVSTLKADQIASQPVSNPLAAMEGRMPGVVVTQNTGVSGGAFTVQVRGQNSIRSGNNPLYLVDGIPFTSTLLGSSFSSVIQQGSPLASINPSDIESIEVLKDADATAIYGSRGANGVVLITTKKGKNGKTTFNVNLSSGIGKVASKMDLLDNGQYLAMRREAFSNDGATPSISDGNANDLLVWDTSRSTDWQKVLIGNTASITNAEFSVSGGNLNTQMLAAGTYHRETTVFPGDFADNKAALHFNINHLSDNKKFRMAISALYSNDNNHLLNADPTGTALTLAPVTPPVYDSAGKLNWEPGFINPYGSLLTNYTMKVDNVLANAIISYELLPGLVAKGSIGYTKIRGNETNIFPLRSLNPANGNLSGYTFFGNSSAETWIAEPQLEYQKSFPSGKLTLLAGATLQQDIKQASLLFATGFLDDALAGNPSAAASISTFHPASDDNYYRKYKYSAAFARINYNWKDKYLLNLTGRRDGSSRFGPGKQFANFGAAGAGWIFSQENFIKKHLRFLSYGKLRASYGTTGNDQIGDYGYLSTYSPSSYPYNGSPGLMPTRLFNATYAWEKNKKSEAAIELGVLNNSIIFTAGYYFNRSSSQLVGLPLPLITGFSSIQSNLPATVQNSGWEFSASITNINKPHFRWSTGFNITLPANKLVAYPNIQGSSYAYTYAVGQPLNIAYKYHETGVSPATGIYQFEDVNKDNNISFPEDDQFIKKVSQSFYGGLENKFNLNNWQLDFLVQFVKQTGYNYKQFFASPGSPYVNQPSWILYRWQHTGDNAPVQKFTTTSGSDANNAYDNAAYEGDGVIGDASYIRLKNVSLSYRLSEHALHALHITSCKLVILGQNLFTVTGYKGLDPETQSSSSLPPLKVLTFGFQLTF